MSIDTSNLFLDILDTKRTAVFAELASIASNWYLAGGTALALQIGHRLSFDFDLFSQNKIESSFRKKLIETFGENTRFALDTDEQITLFTADNIKITFASTPFDPLYPFVEYAALKMESVPDIAADKAFTVGRRGAFRDYVDLFFLLSGEVKLQTVISDAMHKYGAMFDEKLFLEQLDFMDDITDFSIELIGQNVSKEKIKDFLHSQVRAYLQQKSAAL